MRLELNVVADVALEEWSIKLSKNIGDVQELNVDHMEQWTVK